METKTNQSSIDLRPTKLEDFFGNESILRQIKKWKKDNKFPHVILFLGPSGCGKSTLAKIICDDINKNNDCDTQEIDCSDQNKDTLGELKELCSKNSLIFNKRIFILNELQELSSSAQKSLLVLLEQNDPNTYFILTSMEPNKVKDSIKNRSQTLIVKPLNTQEIAKLVGYLYKNKKIDKEIPQEYVIEIMKAISENSNGVPRSICQMFDYFTNVETFDVKQIPSLIKSFVSGDDTVDQNDLFKKIVEFIKNKNTACFNYIKSDNIKWDELWIFYYNLVTDMYLNIMFNVDLNYYEKQNFIGFTIDKNIISKIRKTTIEYNKYFAIKGFITKSDINNYIIDCLEQ